MKCCSNDAVLYKKEMLPRGYAFYQFGGSFLLKCLTSGPSSIPQPGVCYFLAEDPLQIGSIWAFLIKRTFPVCVINKACLCTLRHCVVILFNGRGCVVSLDVTWVYPEKLFFKSRQDAFVILVVARRGQSRAMTISGINSKEHLQQMFYKICGKLVTLFS